MACTVPVTSIGSDKVWQCDECPKLSCNQIRFQWGGHQSSTSGCAPTSATAATYTRPTPYGTYLYALGGGSAFTVNPDAGIYDVRVPGVGSHTGTREVFLKARKTGCCLGKIDDGKAASAVCTVCWRDGTDVCNDHVAGLCGTEIPLMGRLGMDTIPDCMDWRNRHRTDGKYDDMMRRVCVGKNLETKTCLEYCGGEGKVCDSAYQDWCSDLTHDPTNAVCGCFRPQKTYDTFFNEMERNGIRGLPRFKTCYFPACVAAPLKDSQNRGAGRERCVDVGSCVVNNVVNNDGTLNGAPVFDSKNDCKFVTQTGATGSSGSSSGGSANAAPPAGGSVVVGPGGSDGSGNEVITPLPNQETNNTNTGSGTVGPAPDAPDTLFGLDKKVAIALIVAAVLMLLAVIILIVKKLRG